MKKKIKKKIDNKNNVENTISKEIKYLEALITNSQKNVDGTSSTLDSLFQNQVIRLQTQLDKLKEKQ